MLIMLTKFGFKKKHHYHLISQYNLFHFQFSRAQPFLEVMPNTCVQGCPSRNLTSNLSLASRHLQMRRKKQLQGDQHLACDQLLGRDLVTYGYMGVPKSWGYPQSSSISNDGIFHELNLHFWIPPFYGNPHILIHMATMLTSCCCGDCSNSLNLRIGKRMAVFQDCTGLALEIQSWSLKNGMILTSPTML